MHRLGRRWLLVSLAAFFATAGLFYFSRGTSSAPDDIYVRPAASETLPERLSSEEFWRMILEFSEPGGYFRSDNFLSNESGYQHVIPAMTQTAPPNGVYIGVGPEQNFTYIAALAPKMAFIVDIRRQNMLELLLYKAFMELSADRAEFLSRLFARPRPAGLDVDSSPEELFDAYNAAAPNAAHFDASLRQALDHLTLAHGFSLSEQDRQVMEYVYEAFFRGGPNLRYVFFGPGGGFQAWGMPSYAELMMETDGRDRNWSFLATENQFRVVRDLQKRNLIIPIVGDFAGDAALRSIGRYLKEHGAVLSVFYTSNVEQYLFNDGVWERFYANVASLPIHESSLFVRFILNRRGFGFANRIFRSESRTFLAPIGELVIAFRQGKIYSYHEVVEMSY